VKITPLHIELIIHVTCTREPIPHPEAPAVTDYLNDLQKWHLIAPTIYNAPSGWDSLEAGRVFVRMLCDTPIPERFTKVSYRDPRTAKEVEPFL
jgi:hypothetical protein